MADTFFFVGPDNRDLYLRKHGGRAKWSASEVDAGLTFLESIATELMELTTSGPSTPKKDTKPTIMVLRWERVPRTDDSAKEEAGWWIARNGDWRIGRGTTFPDLTTRQFEDPSSPESRRFVLLDAKWASELSKLPNLKGPYHGGVLRNSLRIDHSPDKNLKDVINEWKAAISDKLGDSATLSVLVTSRDVGNHHPVRRDLGLERAVEDLRRVLRLPDFEGFRRFARTIVSLDEGCVMFDWNKGRLAGTHVFYQVLTDENVVSRATIWRIPGASYLVAAAALSQLRNEDPVIGCALKQPNVMLAWLSAISWLQYRGFSASESSTTPPSLPWKEFQDKLKGGLQREMVNDHRHAYAYFQQEDEIALDRVVDRDATMTLAQEVLENGAVALMSGGVPLTRVHKLHVIGRIQREQLRSLQNSLMDYAPSPTTRSRPLSLAVFGPPGCGKSALVKAIAKNLPVERQFDIAEFNLSQLNSPGELNILFNQVRDKGLDGKIPFVFWDEFDGMCNGSELGWLRLFLAPMEDGYYYDQRIRYALGPCVFVFAGGTKPTYQEFVAASKGQQGLKVPDFVSRLSAHLDVPDVNLSEGNGDYTALLRRALILDHLIREQWKEDGKPEIDDEAGKILLQRRARHGARSLRMIVALTRIQNNVLNRAALPPDDILREHLE